MNFSFGNNILIPFGNVAVIASGANLFEKLKTKKEDFEFEASEFEGVPTLTSLAFKYGNTEIVLEECIITVNQEKNIVTTPLQGRNGTVKEFISEGDFSITVEAAVSSYGDQNADPKAYPIEKIKDLVKILKINDGLEIQSDFLTLFDVTSVVILSYAMPQETHSNRQSFMIQMLSDTPFEIKLQEERAVSAFEFFSPLVSQ